MKASVEKKEAKSLRGHWLWGAIVFCVLLLIDLLTKIFAEVYFDILGNKDVVMIPDVIVLTYQENPGMAFSIGANAPPAAKIAVVALTALVMIGAGWLYVAADKRRSCLRWCLVFVVAGGVGNLIDRLLFQVWLENGGGVRDMVALDFGPLLQQWFGWEVTWLNFGVCNFADFFIVGGAVALIVCFLFFDTDAFFPVGKYKALAKEAADKEEAKKAVKQTADKTDTKEQ
jgi:lipoprotein signal peptidase